MPAKYEMPAKKEHHVKAHRVLKVHHVPHEVARTPVQAELPGPVKDLVEAVKAHEIVEIHFDTPEPTRWERLKRWFSREGDD